MRHVRVRPHFESPYPTSISQISDTGWKLVDHIVWHGYNRDGTPFTLEARPGSESDFASVPPSLWAIFPPYGKYTAAVIMHDKMYRDEVPNGRMTYTDADYHLRQMLLAANVSWLRSGCMFAAVRWYTVFYYRHSPSLGEWRQDVPAMIGFSLVCAPYVAIPSLVNKLFGSLFRRTEMITSRIVPAAREQRDM